MDDDVAAALDELRQEIQSLRDDTAQSIRTRRLAVVDEDGIERVILSARFQAGSVLCRIDSPEGETTGIELVAAEDPDGLGEPIVGVVRLEGGNARPRPRRHGV